MSDKYEALRKKFKEDDWVFGIGEHKGCSPVFENPGGVLQPFEYLDDFNPDHFRLATEEEKKTAGWSVPELKKDARACKVTIIHYPKFEHTVCDKEIPEPVIEAVKKILARMSTDEYAGYHPDEQGMRKQIEDLIESYRVAPKDLTRISRWSISQEG